PARLWLVLPARLDQAPVGQPDEDRVQRARLQAGLLGQRVPVLPLRRLIAQRGQHGQGLRRELGTRRHAAHSPYVMGKPSPDDRMSGPGSGLAMTAARELINSPMTGKDISMSAYPPAWAAVLY